MKRELEQQLLIWKQQKQRKPLLLEGARQTGKTYLLKKFAENFPQNFYFDFTRENQLKLVFQEGLAPAQIIERLSVYKEQRIDLTKTLLIFDEIQECPQALTSLKYFHEEYPGAYICASGSFLGMGLSETNFPVGKVERYRLFPLTFKEFLTGTEHAYLQKQLNEITLNNFVSAVLHEKLWEQLKFYFITGGLPEAVMLLNQHRQDLPLAFKQIRQYQRTMVDSYLDDIAKHSGKLKALKIAAVFKDVPLQLARRHDGPNKFVFKDVLPANSRYEQLEAPIEWLIKAGLIHKTYVCHKAELPLAAYCDKNKFNLFLFDIGILGAMVDLEPNVIYNYKYGEYKDYFAENFVLNELLADCPHVGFYNWQENTAEIEFLTAVADQLLPIEVKAGQNSRAKSLRSFIERYHPPQSVLLSALPMQQTASGRWHLPLFLAGKLRELFYAT